MADPRPPDPLDEASGIIQAWKRIGGSWAEHNLTPYMETRLRSLIGVALNEHQATIEALKSQRDKAERQRSEALTQQDTRLEFCRKELEELKAEREKVWHEWLDMFNEETEGLMEPSRNLVMAKLGVRDLVNDLGALREALERLILACDGSPGAFATVDAVIAARAALSGASSPATSKKENE